MRDANGQRFWLLADGRDWHCPGAPAAVEWDGARRALRLASRRTPPAWPAFPGEALTRLEQLRQARDAYGTWARWGSFEQVQRDDTGTVVSKTSIPAVMATGALPESSAHPVPICTTPGMRTPSDLALGYDGVLCIALEGNAEGPGELAFYDRRFRREPAAARREGFAPWRLAADPAGGMWVLDRKARRIGHTAGVLWPRRPYARYSDDTFRPEEENGDPVRLAVLPDATWPAGETTAAIAASPGGTLALLTWAADGTGLVRLLDRERGVFGEPARLAGARYPYSFAWVDDARVAVMLPRVAESPVYPVAAGGDAYPVGDLYPLRDHDGGPFLHGVTLPPHYPTLREPQPLHRLSLPAHAPSGEAASLKVLDSGSTRTVWHRLYVEAEIPPGCAIVVRLAATDDLASPVDPGEWHEHRFGAAWAGEPAAEAPVASWLPFATEVPFAQPMLACAPERGRAGLFTVLVQRPGRTVRSLRGRYLSVRVELRGTGRATPELAAVRAYGSRFSYAENYLPEMYRESVFGPEADAAGPATAADFLERYLGIAESFLTPLEDRVAHAHLLTDPRAAPPEALDWLASWVGLALDPALPPERRRAVVAAAPELAARRGTLRGLALALDLATGGAVRGGEVVVLEDFRLRRTFATVLGADLADETDPLLGGIVASGNSFVGDTLFLGDESRRELLALFDDALPKTREEEDAVRALYDGLAYRVTVLVHQEVEPQDLGLISRVVAREAPAHVDARVVAASHPFVVGVASLVGVDTYLGPKPPLYPVRVDRSHVGVRDVIRTPPSLDPRLEGGEARFQAFPVRRPVARAEPDLLVMYGETFVLDASESEVPPGRFLERYVWTRTQ